MRLLIYILSLAFLLSLSSCFTGVETTKKIKLSKEVKKASRPSEEEAFFSNILPSPLKDWQEGKTFYATDNRALLIFDQEGLPSDPEAVSLKGKVLTFEGVDMRPAPDGRMMAYLNFSDGNTTYRYNTGKTAEGAPESVMSDNIPMLIDLGMVEQAGGLLAGKRLWTRTALWYDENENRLPGLKFVPVTVSKVVPGSMVFPLRVIFVDEKGQPGSVFLNFGHSGTDSRPFSHIFYLEDIRKKYPTISDEVWQLIQQEKIRAGMTKEECRLSLGNPSDVNAGRDYSQTLDLWHYPDGKVLWFEDGLLTRFRQ